MYVEEYYTFIIYKYYIYICLYVSTCIYAICSGFYAFSIDSRSFSREICVVRSITTTLGISHIKIICYDLVMRVLFFSISPLEKVLYLTFNRPLIIKPLKYSWDPQIFWNISQGSLETYFIIFEIFHSMKIKMFKITLMIIFIIQLIST